MAFDLTDTKPFPTFTFDELNTDRPGFTFNSLYESDLNFDLGSLELSDTTKAKAGLPLSDSIIYNPTPKDTAPAAIADTNKILGDYLGTMKSKASKDMFYGASLKTAAAAGKLFTSLVTYGTSMRNANLQASNTKLQADLEMSALDNQVQYYKNQITDKFNTLLARNTVTMAAKGLRVSAGSLLETTKDAAYDTTQDIRMLESNAELKKIALRSSKKQADITKKLQKTLLTANLVKGVTDLGLMVASGGGTMQSWGNLYSNAFGNEGLNESVYGG